MGHSSVQYLTFIYFSCSPTVSTLKHFGANASALLIQVIAHDYLFWQADASCRQRLRRHLGDAPTRGASQCRKPTYGENV